ncbi:RUS1 family protein C16orf58 homolog [Pomacea canaliculata]|uniref:RUS1 family protein C16orf58 homolog n=1 Tax=Pomacea canaliculata TaxID=400727 RepID=UPI000D737A01|nr:RUS1 family protein C16orf58 homolog [Pomacea canaliculata]
MNVFVNMPENFCLREKYGCSKVEKEYCDSPSKCNVHVIDRSPPRTTILQFFRTVFLPQGYPETVSQDYLAYQIWDTVQAFASSLSNSLAAHALLQGIGVGDENATVLAATMTWIMKDGTGMIGRIIFAWLHGSSLDCNAKRWRLFADFLNDIAMCLEILAPLFQAYFRLVVCFAGVCKSIVGVAGGATRAALTQHQARRNNMADVSAKDGSQETLVNLSALLCSIVLLQTVSGHFWLTWIVFSLLTTLHLFANYRAVRAVCMESLNQARLHIIMQDYFSYGTVPDVVTVNLREPVVMIKSQKPNIALGVSFSTACSRYKDFESIKKAYSDLSSKYLLCYSKDRDLLIIVLSHEAEVKDQLQACVQAELLRFLLQKPRQALSPQFQHLVSHLDVDDEVTAMQLTYKASEKLMPSLLQELKSNGWITSYTLLGANEWRASWKFSSSKHD